MSQTLALDDTQIAFVTPHGEVHRVSETGEVMAKDAERVQIHGGRVCILTKNGEYMVNGTIEHVDVIAAHDRVMVTKDGNLVGSPYKLPFPMSSATKVACAESSGFVAVCDGYRLVVVGPDHFKLVLDNVVDCEFAGNRFLYKNSKNTLLMHDTSERGWVDEPTLKIDHVAAFACTAEVLWTIGYLSHELRKHDNFTADGEVVPHFVDKATELFAYGSRLCIRKQASIKVVSMYSLSELWAWSEDDA